MPVMSAAELHQFLIEQFPQIEPARLTVEHVDERTIRVRREVSEADLRPGGTISGPTLMALADTATYLLILAQIGPVALAATTNLNINFLRKPTQQAIIAEGRLMKLGSRLAVVDILLRSEGVMEPVAHATLTYSIPPQKDGAAGRPR
jgi:uncharacterized protein (TIGR00369 family)